MFDDPRSISIPEFKDGLPDTPEFKIIILSSTLRFSVFKVVVVPLTVKFPVIIKLPVFVCSVADVSISPASIAVLLIQAPEKSS